MGRARCCELSAAALAALGARLDRALPVGNEGAGTVVAAGEHVSDLLGRVVALAGGGMWAQYRRARAADCLVLDPGTRARDAASAFVNPLTTLGLLETARRDGHTAVVHTAAASNLGRMLVRVCRADGVGLVNVVRSPEQVELLRSLGAEHVCDSSADDFPDRLRDAVAATGATAAFNAVGGGPLTGQILTAMETVLRGTGAYSLYGSSVRKQVYVYGRLDTRPLEVDLGVGMAWQVGGLVAHALPARASTPTPSEAAGPGRHGADQHLRQRVRRRDPAGRRPAPRRPSPRTPVGDRAEVPDHSRPSVGRALTAGLVDIFARC